MKKSVDVFSFGYPGSGFQFILVRCNSKAELAAYVSRLEEAPKFTVDNAPYAYSYSKAIQVLDGVLPEAHGNRLWVAYLIVVHRDEDGRLDYRHELRHWAHEIGHTLEAFAEEYTDVLAAYYETGEGRVAPQEPHTEAVAYCSEFLNDAVRLFMGNPGNPAGNPMSGLPRCMPWVKATEGGS